MKKSNFIALVLGIISGVFFALGMCMAMIPEWEAFKPGVVLGCIGIVVALIDVFSWRKMEHKEPIKITGKAIMGILVALVGTLCFGVGMCMTMIWSQMVTGVIVGLIGMIILLMLIPIYKGVK